MKDYYFYIRIFPNGDQVVSNHSLRKENDLLVLIVAQLQHSTKELEFYKSRIIEAMKKGEKVLVNYNTLYIYVNEEFCEIGEGSYDVSQFQKVPSSLVLQYIDDAIEFINFYISGGIKGIIPKSKKNEWEIVPKEFVKDVYWKNHEND